MRGIAARVGIILMCALVPGGAGAQFTFTPSFQNYQTFSQRTYGYVAATVQPVFVSRAVEGATRLEAAAPTYRHALPESDFRPVGAPSGQKNCSALATRPADQSQMAALCLALLKQIEAQEGFRRNNLASALGVLIGLSLQVGRGEGLNGGDGLDEAQTDRLIRGLNDLLLDAGTMKGKASDLQAAYESALMTGGLIVTLAQQGRESGDAQLSAAARGLARSVLQSYGVKP